MGAAEKTRNSNMELLRILAITFIVLYHLSVFFTVSANYESSFMYAINLMLHTGVLLFVLISGYFGIVFSFRGLFKLLAMMFVYYVPLMLVWRYLPFGGEKGKLLDTICFVSRTPYWYVRTYLILFVLSPIINSCIAAINTKQRFFILGTLALCAVYFAIVGKDASLSGGKNIVNFFFIYLIGNTIRLYETYLKKALKLRVFSIWLAYNVIFVSFCYFFKGTTLSNAVFALNFIYCSPGLILNAVLLFLAFTDLRLESKTINYLAVSVLAVYLIQEHPVVRYFLKTAVVKLLSGNAFENKAILVILIWITLSITVVVAALFIDKLFAPAWKLAQKAGSRLDKRINLGFSRPEQY